MSQLNICISLKKDQINFCAVLTKNKSCKVLLSLPLSDVRSSIVGWSERLDIAQKLLSLLNSYTPKEVRTACLGKSTAVVGSG